MTERPLFGEVPADLEPGARNAIEVCLSITGADRVALIADETSGPVAASLASALDVVGARWTGVLIEQIASRPLQGAPAEILGALENVDAGILCVQPRPGELGA